MLVSVRALGGSMLWDGWYRMMCSSSWAIEVYCGTALIGTPQQDIIAVIIVATSALLIPTTTSGSHRSGQIDLASLEIVTGTKLLTTRTPLTLLPTHSLVETKTNATTGQNMLLSES